MKKTVKKSMSLLLALLMTVGLLTTGTVTPLALDEPLNHTATFHLAGGSINDSTDDVTYVFAEGDPIIPPPDPIKEDYIFAGWTPELSEYMGNADQEYWATWEILPPQTYSVVFDPAGADYLGNMDDLCQELLPGEPIYVPQEIDLVMTGYVFMGWGAEVPAYMPAEDLYFTAQWLTETNSLTFDPNGGTINGSAAPLVYEGLFEGEPIGAPEDPVRPGYIFLGWDDVVPDEMPATSLYFTALWAQVYTVTFHLNGGNINGVTDDVVYELLEGDPIDPPLDPIIDDFVFAGWTPEVSEYMGTEDQEYWATWNILPPETYFVVFDTAGGDYMGNMDDLAQDLLPGDPIYVPQAADLSKPGYVFMGWDSVVPASMPEENLTFTALWAPLYTVTFLLEGGNINGITDDVVYELAEGDPITVPAENPVRDGYDFLGWDPVPSDLMYDFDQDYYATWEEHQIQEVTVRFVTSLTPLDVYNSQTIALDCTADEPEDPTRTGYIFGGWYRPVDTDDCIWDFGTDGMPIAYIYDADEDDFLPVSLVALYADWEGSGLDDYMEPWDSSLPIDESFMLFAKWTPAAPITIAYHSLSLDGDIGVNFFAEIPNASNDAYAEFIVNGAARTVPIDLDNYYVQDGKVYYRFTCSVHSAQIDMKITGAIHNGDDASDPISYSVHDYLTEAMANPTTQNNQNLMALMSAIATYGYYANELLNYDPDFTIHPLADDAPMAAVTAASLADHAAQITDTAIGVAYYGSSLVLQTTTAIRHYFTVPAGKTVDDFTFLCGGVILTPTANGSLYYVELPNIQSGNLGKTYTVEIFDGSGDTPVNVWSYSALSYAYKALNNPDTASTLANAVKALVVYYQRADAYFHAA